ncbi:hypothetical protein C8F04DRAFT_44140 [Mycena alexandri]|uniref:BZIP domain-containing protein n=1 Tax=Mycena alexandri TaxID=1745969 RepID=A0AAD6WZG7_9AGAR|nr:hypothetical protein C8F04DRAFT_44140 [Mycena alexandri]
MYRTQQAPLSWPQASSAQSYQPLASPQWLTSPMLSSTASDDFDPDIFDHPPLTLADRHRPPTLPPSPAIPFDTPPSAAIPVPSYNHHSTQRQDVRSVLNSSASFKPPSPAPRFNAFPLESPLSSFPASNNVPINSVNTRPRTPPVFPSTSDLAAHYGLPQNFPPPPRPVHRHSSVQKPAPKQPSSVFDFDSIRNNYLTMLSQNPSDNEPAAADAATIAPVPVAGAADPMQAIQDLLASPEFQNMDSFDFDPTSPLFSDTASPLFNDEASFDVDAYLTSPGETPYDDFATSPAEDSPFSDFLTTPVMPMTDDSDMLTGPLIEGDGYGGDLFGGLSTYTYEAPAAPKLPSTEQLYTISPGTPALDSIDPSNTVFSAKSRPASAAPIAEASPSSAPTTRRRATATGTRKNLKPETLIPLEAPTQKRTYVTPSATSRKAVPALFAQKKRAHSVAFAGADDNDEAELGVLSPTASEAETIEYKRRQNTLAARKSRKRKLEHQQMLEDEVVVLKGEVEKWKTRALLGQDMLRANGVPVQPFED